MLYLVMPRGHTFGWGICGKYLTRELSTLSKLTLITEPFDLKDIGDDYDYILLKSVAMDKDSFLASLNGPLQDPVIQAITDHTLLPLQPKIRGSKNIGYTFFETTQLSPESISQAGSRFDLVVAGSTWCESILREHGLNNTCTVIQGVDRSIFNSCENQKAFFRDKFVLFSGGKLELRKGQDLVIKAFKVLQDKYDDVYLINSWYNHWAFSMQTMAASPHIHCDLGAGDYYAMIDKLLADNGIDLRKVLTLPPKPNIAMAKIYRNSDCGIFPNRCEGGTNLILMEYLACGKPAIVSNSSGHRDIIDEENAILLKALKARPFVQYDGSTTLWDEPDLDEIVDRLEWAYLHRDRLKSIGENAGKSMEQYTWQCAAERFYAFTQN